MKSCTKRGDTVSRREFLTASAAGAAMSMRPQSPPIPIIDTHIHFFDTTRPQGVPYPAGKGIPGLPIAIPETFRKAVAQLGIVGAIEVEASPWVEDNLWVLEVAATDSIMVGAVGNLQPDKPEFAEYLDRYHRNQLFLGIRYGNIWGYSLVNQVTNPVFIEGLKLLQQADLVLDT